MKRYLIIFFILLIEISSAQNQNRNWYFGTGTDGIVFNAQNVPVKVSNKYPGVGYEGMAVASDPCSGTLLFYTDGIDVIDQNHNLMTNGSGMLSNYSGSQCVQICKVPGTCKKYYVISNSSVDNSPGSFYYSMVDFTSNSLGEVTIKNQYISGPDYHQAMRIIPKTNSNNYWLIGHLYNTAIYHVIEISPTGFSNPVVYNFLNSGRSWAMEYNEPTHKLVNMGQDNLKVTLFDFNPATGVLSNEQQLYSGTLSAWVGNFSPDGSKIYAGLGTSVSYLWQYDFSNNLWTNMNTCCWAHDVKTGPDGITYFIHSYNNPNPLAQITNANLTALGNACGYSTITNPGNFDGEVRRFPEFLQVPDPPIATPDTVTIAPGSNLILYPLTNDFDPQGDLLSVTGIFSGPSNGNAILNGNTIEYTANAGVCNSSDTITYLIEDNTCMCDTAQIIIYIQGTLPISQFIFQADSCTGLVTINNQSLYSTLFTWDFGDSTAIQSGVSPSHYYSASGTHYIELISSNACGSDTSIAALSMNLFPPTNSAFSSLQANCSMIVNFNNQSQNGISYSWDFGDGLSDTVFNPSHLYADSGTFYIKLISLGICLNDTLITPLIVKGFPELHAEYSYTNSICSNTMSFSDNSNAVSSFWDFGDGSNSALSNSTHTYPDTGIYFVTLISYGQCTNDTVFFTVTDTFSIGIALFDYDQQECESEIKFINQSQNSYSLSWDFGDGTSEMTTSPVHIYSYAGEYNVTLYINQGTLCFDSLERTITAHDPIATSLFVPNTFTPNNDGKNEVFEIFGTLDCDSYQLYIYNRWGNLVYKTDNIWKFWDGKMNGNYVQEGVYCYLITGDNYLKKGSVLVLR